MAFSFERSDVVLALPPAESNRELYDTPDFPAIGIAYIGGYLERTLGITPALIDARLSRLTLEQTVAQILALKPRIVGVSAMTHMIDISAELAAALKQHDPEIFVVIGGIHATFLPERTLKEFPVFDALVCGEGEMAFAELVRRRQAGLDLAGIAGVWLPSQPTAIAGRGAVPDRIDELGEPAWHLYDPAILAAYCTRLPVMGQRGCPFHCNFCSRPYGRTSRRRSPELVAAEIQRGVDTFKVNRFYFYDETFTVNKKHTIDLCKDIVERGLGDKIEWQCSVHANTVDHEVVQAMKSAGCNVVSFGVESGDDDILRSMQKGVTKEKILNARRVFKEVDIPCLAFFLFGHPNESKGSLWRSIKFAVSLNAEFTAIGIMVPYPGTEVWELAVAGQGGYKKLSGNWRDYNKQIGNAVELESISRRELELFQLFGYAMIYLGNGRIGDFWKQITSNLPLVRAILTKMLLPKRA